MKMLHKHSLNLPLQQQFYILDHSAPLQDDFSIKRCSISRIHRIYNFLQTYVMKYTFRYLVAHGIQKENIFRYNSGKTRSPSLIALLYCTTVGGGRLPFNTGDTSAAAALGLSQTLSCFAPCTDSASTCAMSADQDHTEDVEPLPARSPSRLCYEPGGSAAGKQKRRKVRARFSESGETNEDASLTLLHFLLADVVYEIYTEEIIPERLLDEPRTVLSADVMTVAPVVRLTWLPHSAGKQQGATTHKI